LRCDLGVELLEHVRGLRITAEGRPDGRHDVFPRRGPRLALVGHGRRDLAEQFVLLLGDARERREDEVGCRLDELFVGGRLAVVGEHDGRVLAELLELVGDPGQHALVVRGVRLLGDRDRHDADGERRLGAAPAPGRHAFGLCDDLGLAEDVLDRDREGTVGCRTLRGVGLAGRGATREGEGGERRGGDDGERASDVHVFPFWWWSGSVESELAPVESADGHDER
jgi:hypothetical protein